MKEKKLASSAAKPVVKKRSSAKATGSPNRKKPPVGAPSVATAASAAPVDDPYDVGELEKEGSAFTRATDEELEERARCALREADRGARDRVLDIELVAESCLPRRIVESRARAIRSRIAPSTSQADDASTPAPFEALTAADMGVLGCLRKLRLDRHHIAAIDGASLAPLTAVQVLHLQHNRLRDVEPLSHLRSLEFLAVQDNALTELQGLSVLEELAYIDASRNDIRTLDPAQLPPNLRYLRLAGNPVVESDAWPDTRRLLLAHATALHELDGVRVHARDIREAREALGMPVGEGLSDTESEDSEEDDGESGGWDEADAHLRRDVAGTVSSALGDEGPAGSVTEAEARVREGYVRLREGLEQLEGSVTDTRELREALAELEEDMARSLGSLAELGVPADAMLADMAAHSAESRRELRDMLQESAGAVQALIQEARESHVAVRNHLKATAHLRGERGPHLVASTAGPQETATQGPRPPAVAGSASAEVASWQGDGLATGAPPTPGRDHSSAGVLPKEGLTFLEWE